MKHDVHVLKKWHKHRQSTPQGDETNGLTEQDYKTLLEADAVKSRRAVYYYYGQCMGECDLQKTHGNVAAVERLEAIGLIQIVEYLGGLHIAGMQKRFNPSSVVWAYTTVGIIVCQMKLGIRTNEWADFKIDEEAIIDASNKSMEHVYVNQKLVEQLKRNHDIWLARAKHQK